MKSKSILLVIQVIAWLVFILFPAFIFSTIQPAFPNGSMNPALKGIIILHSLLIAFYYFNYFFAIPKYYFSNRTGVYFGMLIICLLSLLFIMELNDEFNPFYHSELRQANLLFIFSVILRFLMIFLLSLGIASYNRIKQAEEGKLKAELAYLKAQVNPHFLFNTLNSIYALTVKKSDSAPESVTKLSSIMRYVISEATHDFVPLEKELNYVTDYIELEKLRITNKVHLNYTITGDAHGQLIVPLIFIPFIENAFKYGVSTKENSDILIFIEIKHNRLNLLVRNTKVRPDKTGKTGLGINNTTKRLELLYPGKHMLEIKDTENLFEVKLDLVLND